LILANSKPSKAWNSGIKQGDEIDEIEFSISSFIISIDSAQKLSWTEKITTINE